MGTDAWLDAAFKAVAALFPAGSLFSLPFTVRGLFAVLLVCFVCGSVGSLVVGNRMAFFSDALAHCTFAGIALGLLMGVLAGLAPDNSFYHWGVNLIMVVFGVVVGI